VLTIPFLFQQNPAPVFDCVVVEIVGDKAVTVCDSRNQIPKCTNSSDPNCLQSVIDWPLNIWPDAWPKAERGAVVHAKWVDGHFTPVPCKSEQMHGLYDRPALNAVKGDPGFDCSKAPSAFIQDLLERMKQ
jgi:hypothetical protein